MYVKDTEMQYKKFKKDHGSSNVKQIQNLTCVPGKFKEQLNGTEKPDTG